MRKRNSISSSMDWVYNWSNPYTQLTTRPVRKNKAVKFRNCLASEKGPIERSLKCGKRTSL